MHAFSKNIAELKTNCMAALQNATSAEELDKIRVLYLGKKGHLTALLGNLKTLSLEEKKEIGPLLNTLKTSLNEAIQAKRVELQHEKIAREKSNLSSFDVTAYTPNSSVGSKHLYSSAIEEIENIFISMGYDISFGPEVETDHHNFTALNIPQDHPARDMFDTFWLTKQNILLRTHTSTVQSRIIKENKPPLAVFSTGRCFRHEAVDASHDFMFMQSEGFVIDTNMTLSHLLGTAQEFLRLFFNTQTVDIRTRPGFFPFVEPGVEIDMRCPFCRTGCSVCKKSTWIEVLPGGLIHPNVLRGGGVDPNKYSGFAFCLGLTRLVMIKHRIPDIRLLHGGSMPFLKQF